MLEWICPLDPQVGRHCCQQCDKCDASVGVLNYLVEEVGSIHDRVSFLYKNKKLTFPPHVKMTSS